MDVSPTRGIANEPEVIEFFQKRGWAILDPEGMAMPQKVQLFRRAQAVCALHGAGLTHLVWSEPGCRVLELCAKNYLNGAYEGLALERGLNYRYLVCEADAGCVARVDLKKLQEALDL